MLQRGGRLVARDFGSTGGEEAACLRAAGLAVRSDRVSFVARAGHAESVAGRAIAEGAALHARDAWWYRPPGDQVLIRCEAPHADDLRGAGLATRDELVGLQLIGPKAGAVLRAAGLPIPEPVAVHEEIVLGHEEHTKLELLVDAAGAAALWHALHEAGGPLGLANVGLAAVDRLSAGEHLGDHWHDVPVP